MGIKDRLRDWLFDVDVKAGLPITSTTGQRYAAPDRVSWHKQTQGYLNQVVLACIATRAQTLNEPPLVAVDAKTKEIAPYHPLSRLFRRPNKDMAQSMFWQYVSTYIDIGGNCYIHKVRNVYGQVIALRPYHSGHIVPVSESGEWVDYYKYDFEGITREIPTKDIIHIRSYYIDPNNPVLGLSPIRAAGIDIDTYNELMQTLYSYLRNNGVPSGVLSVNTQINASQTESLREQFQSNTTGRNRGKPVVLPAGMSYTQMGLDVSKLEASGQFSQYETAICGIYRVHPAVAMTTAGLMSSTYSNMQTAFQEYTLLTRVPTWNTWEEQVQLSFNDEYPDIDLEFDTSNVGALQSDPDAVIYPVIASFNANIITVNEARQKIGYPPLQDGGDQFAFQVVPATGGFLSLPSDVDTKWSSNPRINRAESGKIDQSKDQKAADFWNALDKQIRTLTDDLKPYVSETVEKAAKVAARDAMKDTKDTKSKAELELLIGQYMSATGAWRERLVQEIMKLSVQGVGADFASVESNVDAMLRMVTKDMNDKITESIGTIKDEVVGIVTEMSGQSADVIQTRLTEKFDTLSQSRAKAIATTTARANSTAVSEETWTALNEQETDEAEEIVKVWTTRRDGKVRATHKALDGEWVKTGGTFGNGLKGPGLGNVSNAGLVVNCRCVLRPVRRKNL